MGVNISPILSLEAEDSIVPLVLDQSIMEEGGVPFTIFEPVNY